MEIILLGNEDDREWCVYKIEGMLFYGQNINTLV